MRRFSTISLIALLALVLSACGAAPTTGTDATSATTTDATTVTTDATTSTGTDATTVTTDATTTGATTDATTTGATAEATTTGAEATPLVDTTATTTGAATEATPAAGAATPAADTAATPAVSATTDDLIAAATANGNLTTLITAIEAAGLEETLQGVGPYTLFAPTDTAFASLPEGVLTSLLADPTLLGGILSYHVASGQLLAADVANTTSIPTLQGQPITVTTDGTMVRLNGDTMITTTDITTSNGVIHVIDKVLIPSNVTLPAGS